MSHLARPERGLKPATTGQLSRWKASKSGVSLISFATLSTQAGTGQNAPTPLPFAEFRQPFRSDYTLQDCPAMLLTLRAIFLSNCKRQKADACSFCLAAPDKKNNRWKIGFSQKTKSLRDNFRASAGRQKVIAKSFCLSAKAKKKTRWKLVERHKPKSCPDLFLFDGESQKDIAITFCLSASDKKFGRPLFVFCQKTKSYRD